jgi:hypothetical protein
LVAFQMSTAWSTEVVRPDDTLILQFTVSGAGDQRQKEKHIEVNKRIEVSPEVGKGRRKSEDPWGWGYCHFRDIDVVQPCFGEDGHPRLSLRIGAQRDPWESRWWTSDDGRDGDKGTKRI